MSDFFKKGNSDNDAPQDFVLFNSDDSELGDTASVPIVKDTPADNKLNKNDVKPSIEIKLDTTLDPAPIVRTVSSGKPVRNTKSTQNISPVSGTKSEVDKSSLGETRQLDTKNMLNINLGEVQEGYANVPVKQSAHVSVRTPVKNKKKNSNNFFSKHKALTISVASVLTIALLVGMAFGVMVLSNPLYGYNQVAAEKASIMRIREISGNLSSGDKYEVTSLVYGKVQECDLEIGDKVKKGDVLYKIDDTDAKLAIERAENEVERAKDDTSDPTAQATYKIVASEAGTIQKMNVQTGSNVSPGTQVGTYTRADGTAAAIISYVAGSVSGVSVTAGQTVSPGQIVAVVKPSNSQPKKNTKYDEKSSEIDLKSAEQYLENFKIVSPVDGVVVEKNSKEGDNVGLVGLNSKPMMVIMDTSCLEFTFSVDEYELNQYKPGLAVSIEADSIPDTDFSGEVTVVSTEGKVAEDGKTKFDVTVLIDEPGDLKSGMNIKGKVVLDSKQNVLSVPEKALMESDGKNALVFVKSDTPDNVDKDVSKSFENELNYPWIKIPQGCELISVKYGLSDGTNVQILSGIELGDIIVYDPDNENEIIPSTAKDAKADINDDFGLDFDFDERNLDDDFDERNNNGSNGKSKNNDNGNSSSKNSPSNKGSRSDDTSDEDIEKAIREQIEKMQDSY